MPWRWSLWSQSVENVLSMVENDRVYLKDIYYDKDDDPAAVIEREETKKSNLKKMKKRLELFKGREVTRELYRLEVPTSTNEQAIAYRAKKK